MSDEPHNPADDRLLDELRAHFQRTDPVPALVIDSAKAAWETRDLDAQLAEILRDSALEDKELAGVRGVGQRLLTFAFGSRFLEVDVTTAGDDRELSGYVLAEAADALAVEYPDGRIETALDERGRFRAAHVRAGLVRLRVMAAGQSVLVTPWLQF